MNATTNSHTRSESFIHLVGDLQADIKMLIKKEIELAKTEMGEKFKVLGRNAAFGAAGGILALIALFMLLLGIGAIIANLLQRAGLSAGAAYFISYMGLSIVLGGVGYALLQKAMNAFKKISFTPDKALESVKGAEPVPIEIRRAEQKQVKEEKPSSDELQDEVVATRARMDSEMEELRARLSPAYMCRSFWAGMKHHPLRALLVGASTGVGGYLYWRNRHISALHKLDARRKWWQFKHT